MVRRYLASTGVVALVSVQLLTSGLRGQSCLEQLPVVPLPPGDQRFLEDFGTALRRFQAMSLDEFKAEYGPQKAYREAEPTGASDFLRGDSNADGRIDVSDCICTLSGLFLGAGPCGRGAHEDALDADDSGALDITDPIFTLSFLFQGGSPPPAPFPTVGPDPTPDGLLEPWPPAGQNRLGYDPMQAHYLQLITSKLGPLHAGQEAAYRENGFVILDDRKHPSFASALNEVYVNDLPVYVAADVLLDVLHLSFDELLKTIEERLLIGELDAMLTKLDAAIAGLGRHAGGVDASADLDDVAFWVCTARSLLRGEKQPCARQVDPVVLQFLELVAAEDFAPIELFRVPANPEEPEDFSQFKPRGHYTQSEALERYFRAMMWVQRIGTRMAHCPSHAAVAYLLAQGLLESGAMAHWNRINDVLKAVVGISDSLTPPGLIDLAERSGIGSLADLYDEAGFLGFVRTALETGAGQQRIQGQVLWMDPTYVDGFTRPPPMFHVLGQRFIVDSFVFSNVVNDRVRDRALPSPLDAMFVLGNRATVPLLESELELWAPSGYHSSLAALDSIVSSYEPDFWNENLYNAWLTAIRALNADTTGPEYPPVMQTKEWEAKTLNTQLGSWAQLRHDTILYAKQSYTTLACEYPEGWVDPYPELYLALASFAAATLQQLEPLGILDLDPEIERFLAGLQDHSLTLAGIARAELEGAALSPEQTEFLQDIVSLGYVESVSSGWYADLWLHGDLKSAGDFQPTVADVHTCPPGPLCGPVPRILHAGTAQPTLMLLSVHNACGTKAYVGPVFSYHEMVSDTRWTDEEWKARLTGGRPPPPRPAWLDGVAR